MDLRQMIARSLVKRFGYSQEEANDHASQGEVTQDQEWVVHIHRNLRNVLIRDMYLDIVGGLFLHLSEEQNEKGEWSKIII